MKTTIERAYVRGVVGAEYDALTELSLTLAQAQRPWNPYAETCRWVLDSFVESPICGSRWTDCADGPIRPFGASPNARDATAAGAVTVQSRRRRVDVLPTNEPAWRRSRRFHAAARAVLVAGLLLAAPVIAAAQTDALLWVTKVGGNGVVTTVPSFESTCPLGLLRCYFVLPAGTIVTMVAEPVPGVQFKSWGGDADCHDGVVTMSSDRRCLAWFDSGPPTPGGTDFNLDGHSDLLWQHPSGWVTAWLMNRSSLLEAQAIYTGASEWRPVATGDIDGDGWSDLVWQHRTGMVTAWLLRGTTFVDAVAIYTGDTFWRVGAAEDLNHDGQADIIWWVPGHTGSAGYIMCWLTRRGQLQEARELASMEGGASFVGTGDFNSDHQPDLVVQAEDGRVSVIVLGTNLARDSNTTDLYWAPTEWRIVGVGDYHGDGLSDLVWQHHIGYVTVWLMDGVEFREARSIYTGATPWRAIAR